MIGEANHCLSSFAWLQSSSLLCVTLNALLMHLAPMHLQSQRKLMSILQGTRCWIRGSKWKRFRTSHITGTENRSRGTGSEGEACSAASAHSPATAGYVSRNSGGLWGWHYRCWLHQGMVKTVCVSPLLFYYRSTNHRLWAASSSKPVRVVSCGFYRYRSFKV